MLGGCGGSGPSPQVLEAHRLFQIGELHGAIDALHQDESAEASYLKSVALHRLKLQAEVHIEAALEADPENPKYQAFQLRLQLLAGETSVASGLTELYQQHPTNAAVALLAFYGYEGQRVGQLAAKDEEAAAETRELGIEALSSAIVLNAEIPEFQRELLALSSKLKLGKAAESLAEKLREAAPDDATIARQYIATMLQARKINKALESTEKFYREQKKSEAAAEIYAIPLSMVQPTPETDHKFQELVERYPVNSELATKFAIYMTRGRRFADAAPVLDRAIAGQRDRGVRQQLIYVAVDLPLEGGDAEQAARSLARYRDAIQDPLLVAYFEGRLLFLAKRPMQAIQKLNSVIEMQKKTPGSNLSLAAESLKWMRMILRTQVGDKTLEDVQAAIRELEAESEELQQDDPSSTPPETEPAPTSTAAEKPDGSAAP